MTINRIVSFLPSATELLYALGAENMLEGVTHECNYPKEASDKPKVISSVFKSDKLSSYEIDKKTTELINKGKDIFKLDENVLLKAKPDLIISQTTCEVCAAHTNQVKKSLAVLPKKPILYSMDPHSLDEIIQSISDLTKIIRYEKKGSHLQQKLQSKITIIKNKEKKSKPRVLAIEWINPFFTAGHWIPEIVEIAGGQNLVSKKGEHSRKMSMKEIIDCNPDIIIFMPCGFDLKRTHKEYQKFLSSDKNWSKLKAVGNGKVFAVDANSFFSKPSIRTITGIEILAKIIHPTEFKSIETPNNSFLQIK